MHSRIKVADLRRQGYSVKVRHSRFCADREEMVCRKDIEPKFFLAKGGMTEVEVTRPDGKTGYGEAECSIKDNYSRRIGLNIALDRAIKDLTGENHQKEKPGLISRLLNAVKSIASI